mgnify:CR=1 FL=1
MLLKMVLSPHSHCNIGHSERTQSEDSLTDEKRSLALFVRQVMSACLKGYEYKVRVISAHADTLGAMVKDIKSNGRLF